MRKIGTSIAGVAGSITVLMLLSCLVGFVRTWTRNGVLGDIVFGEAYSMINIIPNVLFEVAVGGAFVGAVASLVSGFLAKGMKDELERIVSALATWILAIGLPIAGAVALVAEPITRALLGAHKLPEEFALTATLLRTFALQVPLYGLFVVLTGILQAHKRFLLPVPVPMLLSAAMMAIFAAFAQVASGKQDSPGVLAEAAMVWLGWGTTMGVVAFALPQIVPAARIVKPRPTFRFPDEIARRARGLIGASPSGLFTQQIQIVTIVVVANGFGDTGAYSVYTFANAACMVPCAVLAVPVTTTIFPRLSEAAALPGRPGLTPLTTCPTCLVLDVGIITVALFVALTSPAGLAFETLRPARGADVVTPVMTPGLAGYALIYHGPRVLYAVEASRAVVLVDPPAWLSACTALGANVAIGIDGRRQALTVVGASISVGMTVGIIGQIAAIRKATGKWATVGMTRSALIVETASTMGAALGHMTVRFVPSILGAGGVGTFASAVIGGVVVLSAGGGVVFLFDRDVLRPAGGAKKPGVEGSGAEGPDAEGPVSDGADAQ